MGQELPAVFRPAGEPSYIGPGAFDTITEFAWLERAYRNARKNKRFRPQVMQFTDRLEDNLLDIQAALRDGSYSFGPYRRLWVHIPKKRLVMALKFSDRVVQWSIYQILNPYFDRLFIEDSYACRIGKGSYAAAARLQYWMRQVERKEGGGWVYLKLDISKYFYRVDHNRLLAILGRRIKDPRLMALLRQIIDSSDEPFGLPPGYGPADLAFESWLYNVGMPIGNLTSQLFANIYLNDLDQYAKHALLVHFYIRYMDDIIILARNREEAQRIWTAIDAFLRTELALDLNGKTTIRPVAEGVEFVGLRIWTTHMKLRKSTVGRIKAEVRKISADYFTGEMTAEAYQRRVASISGLLTHTASASLRWRLNEIYLHQKEKYQGGSPMGSTTGAGIPAKGYALTERLCNVLQEQAAIIKEQAQLIAQLGGTNPLAERAARAEREAEELAGSFVY